MSCRGPFLLPFMLLYNVLLVSGSALHGEVSVTSVDFAWAQAPGVEGDWLECGIELRGGSGDSEGGERFNSRVGVSLKVGFRDTGYANDFSFYRSSVKLVALESGQRVRVYFYLPPEIVRRDRLSREPFAWLVGLSVDGNSLPNAPSQYARSLADGRAARSFLERIAEEGPKNDGILLPIYLTPFYQRESGRFRAMPSFVREDESFRSAKKEVL